MRAHHVVVEAGTTLVLPGAVGALEGGCHALAANVVVVHTTHAATFKLAFLLGWCAHAKSDERTNLEGVKKL